MQDARSTIVGRHSGAFADIKGCRDKRKRIKDKGEGEGEGFGKPARQDLYLFSFILYRVYLKMKFLQT